MAALDQELAPFDGSLSGDQQLVHEHGFPEVSVRAEFQARGMDLQVHLPAEDKDRRVWILLADQPEQPDTRAGYLLTATCHRDIAFGDHQRRRYIEFGDDQRRARLSKHFEPFDAGSAALHDHGHVAVDRAHLSEKLDPGYSRVEDVGHDERRSPDLEDLQSLSAVADESARVARRPENLAEEVARLSVVVDDQDVALGHVNPLSEGVRQRNTRGSDFSETWHPLSTPGHRAAGRRV